ncbi:16S rRNA (adenine(1518)-N(6)/adenine(1519)-N(6))-dimethyltransferase RsmA [Colwellia psychrerythraea]|uniref:Ribosomal RNA small subunit methyltransferase A n=1 Tax=Colwellia psychrerythraea (strain 34H / ATCC BAA-681) TaxID=167879 RepID=RSMA_COLP3|nr:16S rRNA (adenine(1518)-N(6)/adenine(1519)-N(6))-dimethyltransferase RsmA [Colwellia psychrerythraea]Q47VJ8.1 RecName: Full=Ribosomal RNA small subunit methyltransferase A; AltName: Full=16S rRNA (adenine(1518)-N(6)/adenine(1519)-N(6))-dimethyltransferase; AltName: Full=16S rRNA dimethyladenosine transferase; AltName: Full=16S rRNA dimethylase; AltName: Full=S-adenosylmethionine-6-N', N'-adenosyl(rRNA) dimethyltransferase [Colwellia psychrerythraea 34H]AAZ26037.1 dimethyladenosine transferase 
MNDKKHLGHQAKKRFGQNFLHNDAVISDIVDAINPEPGENLIEIGPGLGALTEPVIERAGKLSVVELDRDLAHRLRHHPFLAKDLTIYETDALKFDFSELATEEQPLRIFGNLPYNISTPLIFHLLTFKDKVKDMHFMLQKEVVERMAAGPHCKAYGRLSIMTQYQCQVFPVMEIGPEAFKPAPKVDSAIVRLIPHAHIENPVKDINALNTVCLAAFNQRRKTIRNTFKKLITEAQLAELNIDANLRPENLSLDEYKKLADFIVDNPPEAAPVKEKRRMAKNKMTEPANNNLNENSAPEVD